MRGGSRARGRQEVWVTRGSAGLLLVGYVEDFDPVDGEGGFFELFGMGLL